MGTTSVEAVAVIVLVLVLIVFALLVGFVTGVITERSRIGSVPVEAPRRRIYP